VGVLEGGEMRCGWEHGEGEGFREERSVESIPDRQRCL